MKVYRSFLLMVGIMIWLSACGTIRPITLHHAFQDDVEAARKLIPSGHFKQAIDELTLLISMDSKNAEVFFLRGTAYQGIEDFESAIKDYEDVIRINPNSPKAYYNLGMIFAYKARDPQKALNNFDTFLTLAPSHEKAFSVAKVMCSLEEETLDVDLSNFNLSTKGQLLEAVKRHPTSPVPYFLLGQMYEKEGQIDAAIRSYQEAIRLRPTCGLCHQSLGRLFAAKKQPEKAKAHLAKAKLFSL